MFILTPLLMIDKKEEKYFSIYACFEKGFMFMHICFVLQIGEKGFYVLHACLCMFISIYLHTYLFRAPNVMHRKRLHRNRFQQLVGD